MERNSSSLWLPPWTRLEHQARYDFAAQFTRGRRVVDCACGSGIGSVLFAQGASEVYAIDCSSEAISEAVRRSHGSNLKLIKGDAASLSLPSQSADVFISLETIEHLDNDRALIEQAYRILRPGGIFICSTPNREITNPGTSLTDKPWNPFHVREYNLSEFELIVRSRFKIDGVYGQNPASKSVISLKIRLASVIGSGIMIKVNKLLKCRWFIKAAPKYHAVTPVSDRFDYEFYVIVGRVPESKV